jgi:hypothetical protein
MIGLQPEELECVRAFVQLLRHPDPVVGELARQALAYVEILGSQSGNKPPSKTLPLNRFQP